MAELRERRQVIDSTGSRGVAADRSMAAEQQTDQAQPSPAPHDRLKPDNGSSTSADSAVEQTPVYKPGAAVLSMLRFTLRETVYITAITGLAIWAAQSYYGQYTPDKVLFSPERLAKVDGVGSRKVYLAVLGTMFDVTKGWAHYGPNGSYHHFAGRDASRAFVTGATASGAPWNVIESSSHRGQQLTGADDTVHILAGDFEKDLTDDLTGLPPKSLAALVDWRKFYLEHKTYKHKGRVTGRFYAADGNRTAELDRVEGAAAEFTAQQPETPTGLACNVQWSAKGGKEVWCSQDKGFPRRVAAPAAADGAVVERCECSAKPVYSEAARLYEGCGPSATRCRVQAAAA